MDDAPIRKDLGEDGSLALGNAGGRTIDQRYSKLIATSDGHEGVFEQREQRPTCRGIHPLCAQTDDENSVCTDCRFLHEQKLESAEDAEFLRHCRAIRKYVDQSVSALFSPHVAAVLVGANGRVLDIDERSANYLRSSCVLGIRHNQLIAREKDANDHLRQAIDRISAGGKPDTLICSAGWDSPARYAILLHPNPRNTSIVPSETHPVVCFIFPLGRRRVASAQQLISLFGLSPAEARLTRALCHGETLEEYAAAQRVKLPTVKTQLRAVFAKTHTDRQVALVNLIAGIPPLR